MQYLVRQNPHHVGLNLNTASRYYEKTTGRSASKDLSAAKSKVTGAVQQKTHAFTSNMFSGVNDRIQAIAEQQASNVVNSLINLIPDSTKMDTLGNEIGMKIQAMIRENVLPLIFDRMGEAVASTQGLGFVSEAKRRELYSKIIAGVPKSVSMHIDLINTDLTFDIQAIVKKALPYDKFSRVFDRMNPLVQSVQRNVKDVAINTGTSIGLFVAINSFLLGGLVTYGFIKLYNSVD
jgi:hypothetical protein